MHISLAISFAVQGFFPNRDEKNNIIYNIDSFGEALPLLSFLLSVGSSSYGMSKFLLDGPIQFLPKNYPLGGLLSPRFISMCFVNMMFGVRILCLENIFFTTYVYIDNSETFAQKTVAESIEPLIPPEYRLMVFFTPCILSFIVNFVRISRSTNGIRSYLFTYPQFLLSPCFSPIMFEGAGDEKDPYRLKIWRFGSVVNALFIGCIPEAMLICSEFYKQTPSWKFVGANHNNIFENNDALIKSPYGNIIFASATMILFFALIVAVFYNENGLSQEIAKSDCETSTSLARTAEILELPNMRKSNSLELVEDVTELVKKEDNYNQSSHELNSEVMYPKKLSNAIHNIMM